MRLVGTRKVAAAIPGSHCVFVFCQCVLGQDAEPPIALNEQFGVLHGFLCHACEWVNATYVL